MSERMIPRHAWGLLVPVLLLCGMSLLTLQALFSTDPSHVPSGAAIKQGVFVLAGLGVAWLTAWFGYQRLGRISFALFVVCLGLLMIVLIGKHVQIPFVPHKGRNGAWRWIEIGSFQFQPSELMKIVYVLSMGWYLRYRRNYRTFAGLVPPFVLTLIPMGLILVQPDLGTVLLFLPVLFAMLFAAGAKAKHLLAIILLGVLCMPVFWTKIRDYQRLRLVGMVLQSTELRKYFTENDDKWQFFCPPKTDHADWRSQLLHWEARTGFQLVHGKTAIGTGGWFGKGWAQGEFVENGFLLPERENDFVFAMVAHQWGLFGSLLVLLCYGAVVAVGMDVALSTKDPFGRLVAVGISTMIGVQALTNLCMTVGIGPITGVTLPFVSKGGSSLLTSFVCIGLLVSVARYRPLLMGKNPFKFDEPV